MKNKLLQILINEEQNSLSELSQDIIKILPFIKIGNMLQISYTIPGSNKIFLYTGLCISKKINQNKYKIIVKNTFHHVLVERMFLVPSPNIKKINIIN
jgi:ribosomal protein L19